MAEETYELVRHHRLLPEFSGVGSFLRDMAEAALQRNYESISITGHSKGLKIAGGINEDQLKRQAEEISEIDRSLKDSGKKLGVLRSIELNLNPCGQGDMDQTIFAELDIVLGCFHSSLRKMEDQTERYVAALRNPVIQILGHPRGRIYNYRLGLSADWPRIFGTAAELDKALEINAYPDRQDLSPDLVALAKKAGCRMSLVLTRMPFPAFLPTPGGRLCNAGRHQTGTNFEFYDAR